MKHRWIEIRLTEELAASAERLARAEDLTIGQLVRDLLAREIARRYRARPPVRADERLVAPLRARLAPDLAQATGWSDLQRRLERKGYRLAEAGGGLAVRTWPAGARVCKASELGFSYARLMRRFRAPFPGHAHTRLADRMGAAGDAGEDDPVLIEPFDQP